MHVHDQSIEKTILDVNFLWKEERVRLLVGSPRASTTLIYSLGASTTPSYYPGHSTTPSYSPRPSTSPSYSLGPSRNAECANCTLLIGKLHVLEATLEIHMHPEKHTIDSTALLHELYNDMEKFNEAILRKDKCLAAIGERPAEVTNDSKWDDMDENAIANLHLTLAD
ncbi:hypothetical protein Tco_0491235 [Tanacetum coccineum]